MQFPAPDHPASSRRPADTGPAAPASPGPAVRPVRWRERSRLVRWVRLVRTVRPRTFTQKVRYKMLRDHRPLLVTFADKVAVREHVRATVGEGHLPALHAVLDDPAGLVGLELPDRYVLKPSHGSGAVVVVSPGASADARLPEPRWGWVYAHVRPEEADRDVLARIAAGWLTQLYGQGPNREWAYGQVPRRVLVEELLSAADGGVPDDYKLFVFHQRCRFVQLDGGRFGARTQDFYSTDWEHLDLSGGPAWADPPHPRPDRLDALVVLAEALAAGTDFLRVDLYVLADRVVVGELTSYPAGGNSPFEPASWDAEFGRTWRVPRRYR